MRVFTTVPTKNLREAVPRARSTPSARGSRTTRTTVHARDGENFPVDETAGVPRSDASFASYSATRAILEAAAEVPVAPMRQAAAAAALRRNPALAGAAAARRRVFENDGS